MSRATILSAAGVLFLCAAGFAQAEAVRAAAAERVVEDAAVSVPERESEPEAAVEKKEAPAPESKPTAEPTQKGPKVISGMSILGNQEAPKSLILVPWKSSVLGDSLGIATMLDDSKQPVDRDVFMRSLGYYEIRSEKTP